MAPEWKDLFQMGAWAVAIIGGLVAMHKALVEMRRANRQRRDDLRWKQAEMAKKCLDELFTNALAKAALKMLDWEGLQFDLPGGGRSGPIDHPTRRAALRTSHTVFAPGDPGPFIRDAFDALFDGMARLEHFIRINLIVFEDVQQPLSYYVAKLASADEKPVCDAFLRAYEFELTQAFLDRFGAPA